MKPTPLLPTLGGTVSLLSAARWSADGDMILAGEPWQAWRAPSREEIAAAEAKEKAEYRSAISPRFISLGQSGSKRCLTALCFYRDDRT
jgi:hypothetical protein